VNCATHHGRAARTPRAFALPPSATSGPGHEVCRGANSSELQRLRPPERHDRSKKVPRGRPGPFVLKFATRVVGGPFWAATYLPTLFSCRYVPQKNLKNSRNCSGIWDVLGNFAAYTDFRQWAGISRISGKIKQSEIKHWFWFHVSEISRRSGRCQDDPKVCKWCEKLLSHHAHVCKMCTRVHIL
jgi:hypothetical protein